MTFLLKNTNENINIIDFAFSDLRYSHEFHRDNNIINYRIECYNNGNSKIKGIISINNITTITKETNLEYSSALITEQSLISNFQYLIDNHTNLMSEYKIKIDNDEYITNKYFNLNGMNYYILNKTV